MIFFILLITICFPFPEHIAICGLRPQIAIHNLLILYRLSFCDPQAKYCTKLLRNGLRTLSYYVTLSLTQYYRKIFCQFKELFLETLQLHNELSENISAIWYNWKSSDSKQVFPCFFCSMNQMLSLLIITHILGFRQKKIAGTDVSCSCHFFPVWLFFPALPYLGQNVL